MFSNVTYPAPCGTVTNLRLNALIGGLSDLLSAKKNKNLTNEDKYILLNFIFMLRIVNNVAIFLLSKHVKVKIFIIHCIFCLNFIVIGNCNYQNMNK